MAEDRETRRTEGAETLPGGRLRGGGVELLPRVAPENYELGATIARGGMGRIQEAHDKRLNRPVAIKTMLSGEPASLRRFEREILITAELQHPAIIAVYEAGQWGDSGLPFLAMKRVVGRPLSEVIQSATSLQARFAFLPNVLAVAEAVAYAHSRGIIHRDLKPPNVLVGSFGETVVIDWGVAKRLASDRDSIDPSIGELTSVGALVGTPDYMSPEQALGEMLDARSDVYALGALLYSLLSGLAPYQGVGSRELMAVVRARPPVPLSQLVPELPRDLLSIVDKAMARDPAERYPTAQDLADELRRFLTGRLVTAHVYTAREMLRRWVRRHRTALVVAVTAFVLLAVLSAFSVVRILDERDRAQRESEIAAAQRERAETQWIAAEGLIAYLLTDLEARVETLGRLDLLQGVARKVESYYSAVGLDDEELPADAIRRAAAAMVLVGEVHVAQGDLDAAKAAFERSLTLASRLGTGAESDDGLMIALLRVGDVFRAKGDLRAATSAYERARVAAEEVELATGGIEAERLGASAITSLASIKARRGDRKGALETFQRALQKVEGVCSRAPRHAGARRDLYWACLNVGNGHMMLDDARAAREAYERSLAIARELSASDPEHIGRRRDVSVAVERLGSALMELGEWSAARAAYDEAFEFDRWKLERAPWNTDWQRDMSVSHNHVGHVLEASGDLAGALRAYREALAIREKLAAQEPSNTRWQIDLAVNRMFIAEALEQKGDLRGALREQQERRSILRGLLAVDSDNADWQWRLAASSRDAARLMRRLGDRAGASEAASQGIAILEKLVERHPDNERWKEELAALRKRFSR